MSVEEIQAWAEGAAGMPMITDYTVAWVAVDHPEGRALATKWIESDNAEVAAAGWCTYSGLVTTKADNDLDLAEIEKLLDHCVKHIATVDDRVRSKMNSFIIAVGTYVKPLSELAKSTANQIGKVSVDVGDTACKVPQALEYIAKAEAAGKVGQKRKTIRC